MLTMKRFLSLVALLLILNFTVLILLNKTGVIIVNAQNQSAKVFSSITNSSNNIEKLDNQQLTTMLEDYDCRIQELESMVQNNSEVFNIYKDYVTNLLIILSAVVALASAVLIYVTQLINESKMQKSIKELITQEKLEQLTNPVVERFLNEEKQKFNLSRENYDQELTKLITMFKNWGDRNGLYK